MKIYKTMENGVRIVEYEDTLAAALADMWNKSGDSWGGDSSVSTKKQIIAEYSSGAFFNVFVALDEKNEAVGLCSFDRYYKDENTAYVHVLNVRPDYHGKKVGKELVLACVNRTIELGFPRLDIHTWAGNTKAVPLYKKCGFLWEDRADTTHLSNFIPTVLKTELFSDFFKNADWYKDSNKIIEIKPDGIKINKFEIYGYSWEKNGKKLSVGFEKTGRRIRFAETDDYKIEFTAENHELAFGLNYSCTFKIENKSKKDLKIKISGKNNEDIKFDYKTEENIENTKELTASFYVEPISEEIDIWRMHPCVTADVEINGKHAEFGLGIEPKFPLEVKLIEKRHKIAKPGMKEDVYINIKSALSKKASVNFCIPKNKMTRFTDNEFKTKIDPGKICQIHTYAKISACGYEKLDIDYSVTLEDNSRINFKKPLHLINQSFDLSFNYETDTEYCAVNGLWIFSLYKQNNHSSLYREAGHGQAQFPMPKLGKPYDDEFNLAKPSDVRIYKKKELTVFEADYKSSKFLGALLTVINEFNSSGVFYRRYKIKNNSEKPLKLYLQDGFWSSAARRSVFCYDGKIQEIKNNDTYGFSDIHSEKIDENWIFDNSVYNKSGMYWNKRYKPVTRWGDELLFEYETGELLPGAEFKTKPNVYMSGIFHNFREFRNYVLGINDEINPYTEEPLDININSRNPFIKTKTKKITAKIKNNRLKIYSGDIKINSKEGLFDEIIQINPENEIVGSNIFDLQLNKTNPGIYLAKIDMDFQVWKKSEKRILFTAEKSGKILTEEKNGVYKINNGIIEYKTDPKYFSAVYSLKYKENEWLFSKYPIHEPYSWWNPFIGGISMNIWQMNANLAVREKTSVEFVVIKDNFKTEWTGVKSVVSINEFSDHLGLSYEQYYLTLPNLPVLCYFVKFINNTGAYKHIGYDMNAYISGKENLGDIYAKTINEKDEYDLRIGDAWGGSDKLVKFSFEKNSKRDENLYIFTDNERNNGGLGVSSDINTCCAYTSANTNIKNGESSSLRPVFFIFTEKELKAEYMCDLERIIFKS